MTSMAPEEARNLIDAAHGLSPRLDHDLPYIVDGKDIVDMAETIARLSWEYGISNGAEEIWCPTQNDAEDMHGIYAYQGIDVRLVRRLVSQPEEVQP